MLSAKLIEHIAQEIRDSDAPDAIAVLLQEYIKQHAEIQAQRTLLESKEHYISQVFWTSSRPVIRLGKDGKIRDVNGAFQNTCKRSPAETVGRTLETVFKTGSDVFAALNTGASSEYGEVQFSSIRTDGKTIHIRAEWYPDFDREESYLVLSDITTQQRFAETMAQDSVRGEIFIDIVNALWQDFMNYEKTLDILTNKIAQHIGGSCIIHLLVESSDIIEHVAINHSNPQAMMLFQDLLYSTKWHALEGLPEEVVLGGNALLIPTVTKENAAMLGNERFASCLETLHTQSFLMLPMYYSERIIGTMTLLRTVSHEPYTNRDKTFTQRIANIGALAIMNAQRMRRMNNELLDKLRRARKEMRHFMLLESAFQAFGLLYQESGEGENIPEKILQLIAEALDADAAFLACAENIPGMFTALQQWTNGAFSPALLEHAGKQFALPEIWVLPLEAGVLFHREIEDFDDAEKAFVKDSGITSVSIVPIIEQERLRGILVFESCASQSGCLEKNEETLKTFARIAGSALLHKREIAHV